MCNEVYQKRDYNYNYLKCSEIPETGIGYKMFTVKEGTKAPLFQWNVLMPYSSDNEINVGATIKWEGEIYYDEDKKEFYIDENGPMAERGFCFFEKYEDALNVLIRGGFGERRGYRTVICKVEYSGGLQRRIDYIIGYETGSEPETIYPFFCLCKEFKILKIISE